MHGLREMAESFEHKGLQCLGKTQRSSFLLGNWFEVVLGSPFDLCLYRDVRITLVYVYFFSEV